MIDDVAWVTVFRCIDEHAQILTSINKYAYAHKTAQPQITLAA